MFPSHKTVIWKQAHKPILKSDFLTMVRKPRIQVLAAHPPFWGSKN